MSEESKAYRLYNPVSKKVIVSRDIVFVEDKKWEWGENSAELETDVLEWGDEDTRVMTDSNQDHFEEGVHAETEATEQMGTGNATTEEEEPEVTEFWVLETKEQEVPSNQQFKEGKEKSLLG